MWLICIGFALNSWPVYRDGSSTLVPVLKRALNTFLKWWVLKCKFTKCFIQIQCLEPIPMIPSLQLKITGLTPLSLHIIMNLCRYPSSNTCTLLSIRHLIWGEAPSHPLHGPKVKPMVWEPLTPAIALILSCWVVATAMYDRTTAAQPRRWGGWKAEEEQIEVKKSKREREENPTSACSN